MTRHRSAFRSNVVNITKITNIRYEYEHDKQ